MMNTERVVERSKAYLRLAEKQREHLLKLMVRQSVSDLRVRVMAQEQFQLPHCHAAIARILALAQPTSWKILHVCLIVVTGGLLWLLQYWRPQYVWPWLTRHVDLADAEMILVIHEDGNGFIEPTVKVI
jgi:hypothetical protein